MPGNDNSVNESLIIRDYDSVKITRAGREPELLKWWNWKDKKE